MKGKRQEAKGKGQKDGALRTKNSLSLLVFAFCLLPFALW
jgi:hypothetical protein